MRLLSLVPRPLPLESGRGLGTRLEVTMMPGSRYQMLGSQLDDCKISRATGDSS